MRSSRLLGILLLLQARTRLTAAELAAEFEVTERTIYRDIDALSAAGVPVYGDRGPGGGFSLLHGYRTNLTGLDVAESQALPLLGLSPLAHSLGIGSAVQSARRKLFATLNVSGRSHADRIGARFHFDATDWYQFNEPLPHLRSVARAVFEGFAASITYRSWRGVRQWEVEPIGIVYKAGNWYLVAKSDEKPLTFRVSSILDCSVGDRQIDRSGNFDLAAYWAESSRRFERQIKARRAIVRASAEGRRRLVEIGALPPSMLDPHGGQADIEISVEVDDMTARQMLYMGDTVEVMRPAALRRAISSLARRVAVLHEPNP